MGREMKAELSTLCFVRHKSNFLLKDVNSKALAIRNFSIWASSYDP